MIETQTAFPYPVKRIAFERTVRLVATARLRDPVLRKLVGEEFFDDLAEIEGATNGRLTAEQRGGDAINANEFVAGLPNAAFINAAFSYWRPRDLNRFNGPGRGAWYSALTVETSIEEVTFHMTRELERVNEFNAVVDYAELFASFAGEFADLREVKPSPQCLNPDTTIGYPEGNKVAELVRSIGYNGIIYPSVRHKEGTYVVALFPHAVQSVAQGRVLRLTWTNRNKPSLSFL